MKTENLGVTTPLIPVSEECDGIFIRVNEYYNKYLYSDILWIEASGSYSYFYLKDKSRLVVSCRLAVVEQQLPDSRFVRAHRGFILNLHHVDRFIGNSFRIGDKWFPVGDSYRKKVLSCFNFLELSPGRHKMTNESDPII